MKVGTGVLEIVRLRMDRQTSAGVSVLRQYANPGQTYGMNPGETIELWAEFDTAGVPRNPRLVVNWGEGEADFTGCGSCRLTHRYNTAGLYTVSARLDDLSGTAVTRTFTLDSRAPAPTPTPSPYANISVELVTGNTLVPNGCNPGDYECQAKAVCDFVTGQTCIRQNYDCYTGTSGSYYPPSTPGGSDFNFSTLAVIGGYGNVCGCNTTLFDSYGLARLWTYCGLGQWNRN